MIIRHYYHIYAAGAWTEPVREHAEALGKAGFEGNTVVGLIGPPADRARAREMVTLRFESAGVDLPTAWLEADGGFEQLTLTALREFTRNRAEEHAVLYAHTKGALDNSPWNAHWRRSMTRHVVGNWRTCAELVTSDGYDTAGCHWLTPEDNHNPPDYLVPSPFYGGNFWWARSSYLRTLPPLRYGHRTDAEYWVGLGNPKAYDLLPGWPSMKICVPQ